MKWTTPSANGLASLVNADVNGWVELCCTQEEKMMHTFISGVAMQENG